MKKGIYIALIALSSLCLVSCAQAENAQTSNEKAETVQTTDTEIQEDNTLANINLAANIMGRKMGIDNNVTLNANELNFVSNDVKLWGYDGKFEHGFTDTGEKEKTIDLMTWHSNEAVEYSAVFDGVKELYGDYTRVGNYHEESDCAFIWENVDAYNYVIFWSNADKSVSVRWISNIFQSEKELSSKKPEIGMTAEEVKKTLWGEPDDINKTTTKYGVHEQWVYKMYNKTKYVYLDDGIVTAIQE